VRAGLAALFMAASFHGMGQVSTLYSFQLGPVNPQGGLVAGPDGGLYGTTYGGGLCGYGTAYRLSTNGVPGTNGVMTSLFSFCYTNGANPVTALARRKGSTDSSLYGTTYQGGSNGFGTVFSMTTTSGPSLLATFGRANGAYPAGALVSDTNGNLYGTTYAGGASAAGVFSGFGTIFKLTAEGGGSYSLHTLVSLYSTNGAGPQGALAVGRDGNLYGTTTSGGLTGNGTAFRMTPGGELSTLVSFSAFNGASPCGGLVLGSNGVFYGTTAGGGSSSNGTVFAMAADGELTTMFVFNGANGSNPQAGLASADGKNFFGTTYSGGLNGLGTIFRIAPDGSLTTLVSFDYANGANPQGPLCLAGDGIFYGTTEKGGLNGAGTAFSLTTNGDFITVASFAPGAGFPAGGLLSCTNGNFYGTTAYGGPNNGGTVFELTSNGVLSMLIPFVGSTNGRPQGNLVQGSDRALYGTTFGGGAGGLGSVFRATSTGAVATVVSFINNNGAYPLAGLLAAGTNGNLYGTTSQGGPSDTGTAFQLTVTPTNTFLMTDLASFLDYSPVDGAFPEGPMAQGTNGNFYGTTAEGGTYNCGAIFGLVATNAVTTNTVGTTNTVVTTTTVGTTPTVVTTTTVLTTTTVVTNAIYFLTNVFSFAYTNGCSPQTGLIVDSNGNFYGTTAAGGSNGCGTVFRMTPDYHVTSLASFGGDNGVTPQGPLFEATDGTIYGTTYSGGPGGCGTVFSLSAGVLTNLAVFYGTNGAYPNGGLVLGQDGRIYGTTSQGGTWGAGTVFSFGTTNTTGGSYPTRDGSGAGTVSSLGTPASLSYSRAAAQFIVSRSTNAVGFTLQSSTNLANWVNVEGQYAVTNDCSQGSTFYRLVNTNQSPGQF